MLRWLAVAGGRGEVGEEKVEGEEEGNRHRELGGHGFAGGSGAWRVLLAHGTAGVLFICEGASGEGHA